MTVNYKGFEINVDREECLAGYELLYYSVYREEDGLEVICSFEDSAEKVRDMVKAMKSRVDEFLATRGASEELEDMFELESMP